MGRAAFPADPASIKMLSDKQVHKFDEPFNQLSYKQYFLSTINPVVKLLRSLEADMGKEKLVNLIKADTEKNLTAYGKYQASQSQAKDLPAYVKQFKNKEAYGNILTFDIVEESDTVFEMRVTECIYSTVYRALNASEYGYASVCWGDYGWAKGYNPDFKLERNKTLMEGHDCCNHRYIQTK